MKYLLDTCVLSEVARPRPASAVVRWLERADELSLGISSLTFGEIQFGVLRLPQGRRRQRLTRWLEELDLRFDGRVLPVDTRVAAVWGELRAEAVARGRSVPVVDGLLAATAISHGLVLVTRNVVDVVATRARVLDPWVA